MVASIFSRLARLGRSLIPASPHELLGDAKPVYLMTSPMLENEWRVVTDDSIKGTSKASFDGLVEGEVSFARFSGSLKKPVGDHNLKARSGFVALQKNHWDPPICLGDFNYLRVKIRSDGRPYLINLRVDSFNHEDLYQGSLLSLPGEWTSLNVPFSSFALTGRGRLRASQRKLDGDAELQNIGILLADSNGPFCLDIKEISLHS